MTHDEVRGMVRNRRVNELGLSVEAFAIEIGVSPDVVRNLEKTGRRPLPANAITVAKYFDSTPDGVWDVEGVPA